jgi:Protein of unknown function (DUF2800)
MALHVDSKYIAEALSMVDMIEDFCKAVRVQAAALMHQGYDLPGYKLVKGKRGNRTWRNEAEVAKVLAPLGEAAYAPRVVLSPAAVEKLLKKDAKGVDISLLFGETHVNQSEGGLHVAPDSDTRPAVVVGQVADEFNILTDEVKDLA